MFFRFLFFAFLGYLLLYVIKFLLKVFIKTPKNTGVKTGNDSSAKPQPENQFDKKKAIDADFEELK